MPILLLKLNYKADTYTVTKGWYLYQYWNWDYKADAYTVTKTETIRQMPILLLKLNYKADTYTVIKGLIPIPILKLRL